MEQSRYGDAVRELRSAIGADPGNPAPHATLAFCLAELKKHDEAVESAREAIRLGPDDPYTHYALAYAFNEADRMKEADSAIKEAIRLDPEDPDHWSMQGGIYLGLRNWKAAAAAADRGLALQADHIHCNNIRAMALNKMGRRAEAGIALDSALSADPENATTHANRGWALLEQRRTQDALIHFREALRLDPQHEWAREGILEALRARNPLYRAMLGYFFFMGRLSDRMQWAFFIGIWLGYRVIRGIAQENPHLRPILVPLVALYFLFIYLSWTARPIFNLLLRLDPFGRLALTPDQIKASNLVGACLASAIVAFALGIPLDILWLALAGLPLAMLPIPISATFEAYNPKRRGTLATCTVVLAAASAIGIMLIAAGVEGAGFGIFGLTMLGFLLFTWGAAFSRH
jgi:tetratricopeptide (TPR) repeat protein